MKTKTIFLALIGLLSFGWMQAQDRTTVTATSNDISDNLDLRAVASIFGDSRDLEDFERRLNDPKTQISNLDLNADGYVDYLRVIETTENNLHLIVIQSVLDKDVFQDVATINVERSGDNVSVQVVGDTYMYGPNYIYEPVYVVRPVIFGFFWGPVYRPYYSPYYYGYYPSYYTYWRPYPIYRYRNNVHVHINVHNHYNYVTVRNPRAATLYDGRRQSGYERINPGRSFTQRTQSTNKHDYDVVRGKDTKSPTRTSNGVRNQNGTRTATTGGTRLQSSGTRTNNGRTVMTPNNGAVREKSEPQTGRTTGRTETIATPSSGNGRNIQGAKGSPSRSQEVSQPVRQTPATGRATQVSQPVRQPSAPQTTTQRSFPTRSQSPSVQQAPQRQQPGARAQGNGGGGGRNGGSERRQR